MANEVVDLKNKILFDVAKIYDLMQKIMELDAEIEKMEDPEAATLMAGVVVSKGNELDDRVEIIYTDINNYLAKCSELNLPLDMTMVRLKKEIEKSRV